MTTQTKPVPASLDAMAPAWPISFGDVMEARARLAPYLTPTPLRRYPQLDALIGGGTSLFVKHENHQPTCSFKVRNGLSFITGLRPTSGRAVSSRRPPAITGRASPMPRRSSVCA